jgi:CRISPR-associated endonuclease/helicase Cas3
LADPDDLHVLERYYRRLYSSLNLDEGERGAKIQDARQALDFRAVADGPLIDPSEPGRDYKRAFRMIDEETTPVVATGDGAPGGPGEVPDLLDQLRAASGPRREVFRALQQFTVALPHWVVTQPAVAAICRPVVGDLLEWRGRYDLQLGINEDEIASETVW